MILMYENISKPGESSPVDMRVLCSQIFVQLLYGFANYRKAINDSVLIHHRLRICLESIIGIGFDPFYTLDDVFAIKPLGFVS